uniref:Uncharacterized protein n=1 Tax=Arundo donax TaxID=35708 RepID=A0A0A8XTI6_ARUDO
MLQPKYTKKTLMHFKELTLLECHFLNSGTDTFNEPNLNE